MLNSNLPSVVAGRAPVLVSASGERASYRLFEFFTAQVRNPHARRAYRQREIYRSDCASVDVPAEFKCARRVFGLGSVHAMF